MVYCCKECTDRYIGCHGKCEKYIEEKKRYLEQKKKDDSENLKFGDGNGHRVMRRHKPVSTHGRIKTY